MITKTVKVPVRICTPWDQKNPIHANMYVYRELEKAGIPLAGGGLGIRCVTSGELRMRIETENGVEMYAYTWTGEQPVAVTEDDEL